MRLRWWDERTRGPPYVMNVRSGSGTLRVPVRLRRYEAFALTRSQPRIASSRSSSISGYLVQKETRSVRARSAR